MYHLMTCTLPSSVFFFLSDLFLTMKNDRMFETWINKVVSFLDLFECLWVSCLSLVTFYNSDSSIMIKIDISASIAVLQIKVEPSLYCMHGAANSLKPYWHLYNVCLMWLAICNVTSRISTVTWNVASSRQSTDSIHLNHYSYSRQWRNCNEFIWQITTGWLYISHLIIFLFFWGFFQLCWKRKTMVELFKLLAV